jgi:hypothetical protein
MAHAKAPRRKAGRIKAGRPCSGMTYLAARLCVRRVVVVALVRKELTTTTQRHQEHEETKSEAGQREPDYETEKNQYANGHREHRGGVLQDLGVRSAAFVPSSGRGELTAEASVTSVAICLRIPSTRMRHENMTRPAEGSLSLMCARTFRTAHACQRWIARREDSPVNCRAGRDVCARRAFFRSLCTSHAGQATELEKESLTAENSRKKAPGGAVLAGGPVLQ